MDLTAEQLEAIYDAIKNIVNVKQADIRNQTHTYQKHAKEVGQASKFTVIVTHSNRMNRVRINVQHDNQLLLRDLHRALSDLALQGQLSPGSELSYDKRRLRFSFVVNL